MPLDIVKFTSSRHRILVYVAKPELTIRGLAPIIVLITTFAILTVVAALAKREDPLEGCCLRDDEHPPAYDQCS